MLENCFMKTYPIGWINSIINRENSKLMRFGLLLLCVLLMSFSQKENKDISAGTKVKSMKTKDLPDMSKEIVKKFKRYFTELNLEDLSVLNEIYSDKVLFQDPIHEINGIENLKSYFKKLNENLIQGSFLFTDETIIDNRAYLSWELILRLKKPNKKVRASGISVLTFEQKITQQRDYFDAGELFYENIPVLGGIIRLLKKKIANQ